MGNFDKMKVGVESKILAVKIYKITGKGNFIKDYSFRDQIRRAAISIPSNLAEGEEAGFEKTSIRYFNIASASLSELKTQIEIAKMIGYLRESDYHLLEASMVLLSKRIKSLIKNRKNQL